MKNFALILVGLLTVVSTVGWGMARPQAALPPNFTDTLVANVGGPTALAFTPDGRMLVTTQGGLLNVYQDSTLLGTALNLSSVICSNSERGLLGVAIDPNFSSNRYIYLYYTFKKSGSCPNNSSNSPVNRVSRFTLADTNTINPASEVVLVDNMPSPNGNHNAGDLHFGQDGYLYISVGDGGCDYAGNSGCAGSNDASRDQHILLGKILRITRDGGIPPTNPFQGTNTAHCNVTGHTDPGNKCQETFAWGLRNPFRFAFRPGTNQFYINDVGQGTWEEIDEGLSGADYGWNVREGHCANGSTTNCSSPPAGMTNPIYDYGRGTGCASITGGAFVPAGVWPAPYDGAYLFSDYVCGRIFRLVPGGGGSFTATDFATGLGNSSAVALIFGPYNATQALYYTTYAGGGQVRRISYLGANNLPNANASANPIYGPTPLSVTFDATGSNDPDNDPLTFDWDFGDGVTATVTSLTTGHQYPSQGIYTATLTARDNRGGVSVPAIVRVYPGNSPPALTIISPTISSLFSVGQNVTLQGQATDTEDGGVLPDSALTWEVILHHVDSSNPGTAHTHPYHGPVSGNNLSFAAPAPEDLAAAALSFLEIRLSATDSWGLAATITQTLQPRRVNVTFVTEPESLNLVANGGTITTTQTLVSWQGYGLNMLAPIQVDNQGKGWAFSAWSDGGDLAHTIVTPSSAVTYTATFTPALPMWLPVLFK